MRGKDITPILFLIGLALAFTGIFIESHIKLTSLGTLVLLSSILFAPKRWTKLLDKKLIVFLIPVFFAGSNYLRTGTGNVNNQELFVILGMLVIAASVFLHAEEFKKRMGILALGAVIIVLFVNLGSLVNYFIDRSYHDQMLLQSKSIPIIFGMHHIHFGVLNAITIAVLLYQVLINKTTFISRYFLPLVSILLLVSFHVLSSRTGMVSFYTALIITLLVYSASKRNYKPVIYGITLAVAANGIALAASSSFRSKLSNSMEDINSWGKGDEINYKSMAMRIEAYKVSYLAMKDRLFIGYGATDLNKTIQHYYEEINTPLYQENRVGPHNQYLEYGIKYGLWGFAFVLCFYLYWFALSFKSRNFLLMFITLILAFSCVFESLHERQVSAFLVACSLPVIFLYKADELTLKQH